MDHDNGFLQHVYLLALRVAGKAYESDVNNVKTTAAEGSVFSFVSLGYQG